MSKDRDRIKELALELREIYKDNKASRNESKFTTFFKYMLNEDFSHGARRKLWKSLMEYQYLMGKCKEEFLFEVQDE